VALAFIECFIMKRCASCFELKQSAEFSWKHKHLGTLATYCKPCQREYCRSHYRKNRERHNQRRYANQAAYRERNRDLVTSYLLTHPCVDCGDKDPLMLDFDHVRGRKTDDISRMISIGMSLGQIKLEIEKCVVRCSNCHRRKTAKELTWFKDRRAARLNVVLRTEP
jgi:hypothetical protein